MKHTSNSFTQDRAAPASANERRVLSQRELAKEKRHAMYQRAKEQRATNPRYLAMKEAAKAQQRAAYQKVKERRKAEAAHEKAKRKAEHGVACTRRREESDRELMKLVTWMAKASIPQND